MHVIYCCKRIRSPWLFFVKVKSSDVKLQTIFCKAGQCEVDMFKVETISFSSVQFLALFQNWISFWVGGGEDAPSHWSNIFGLRLPQPPRYVNLQNSQGILLHRGLSLKCNRQPLLIEFKQGTIPTNKSPWLNTILHTKLFKKPPYDH